MRQAGTGLFRAGIVGDAGRSGVMMRKCACGTHAPAECDDCKRQRVQRKAIAIGPSQGPMEDEADRAARAVMGGHGTHLAGGQPLRLSRAPDAGPSTGGDGSAPPAVDATLRSPGQPLDAATRAFMEPRFGHDFSHVRVHADAPAAESARSVGALAYTVGSDVVFGAGHYQPGGSTGRALLAHELAHVVQQQGGGLLQRAPDPAAVADFNKRFAKIKLHARYAPLPADAKTELNEIADFARTRNDIGEIADRLEALFRTAEMPSAAQATTTRAGTAKAAADEAARLAPGSVGAAQKDKEKVAGARPGRVYTQTPGDGATFGLDARDVTDVAVRAKVRLTKKGSGNDTDVLNVKSLQDAIEKRSNTFGYALEMEFVDTSGPDVFEAGVDTANWVVSDNWVYSAVEIAHELHHRLGLKEDRYDYKNHADNDQMRIPTRIHWFRTEMTKVVGNTELSIMNTGNSLPQDDDVCMIAGRKTKADIDACVKTRSAARAAKLDPALKQANDHAKKAAAALAGPPPVGGPPGAGAGSRAPTPVDKQALALGIAKQVFGKAMPLATLTAPIAALPAQLVFNNLYLVNLLTAGCDTRSALVHTDAPRIRLCPSFLDLPAPAQARSLLNEALHVVGVGSVGTDAACAKGGCADACGTEANATAWVRLIECSANL